VLPSGRAVLFTRSSLEPGFEPRIDALFFDTGATRTVVDNATYPVYLPTGHLLFARAETILAVSFDEKRCETTGTAVPILDHVWVSPLGAANLAVSQTGTLVYLSTSVVQGRLLLVDRNGGEELLTSLSRNYADPRVSPDGRSIVVSAEGKLWLLDPERDTMTRFTFGPGASQDRGVWTPDGDRVLFRDGGLLASKAADGSSGEETIQTEASVVLPTSVSPDGETLAALELNPLTSGDIVMVPLHQGGETTRTFLGTPAYEGGAQFSPDGRLILYVSNESGRMEIYLQPYPGPGAKTQISADGGSQPRWRRDGREIFYRNGPKMMAVTVSTGERPTVGKPALLFEKDYSYSQGITIPSYDVTPDGHFVMVKTEPPKLNVVLNWFEELKQKVPAR
jgi:Tol biopolymer transport system component